MPKGKLANPEWIKCRCQYCDKEFDYYREISTVRKSCYECIPDGKGNDAALIKQKGINYKGNKCYYCNISFPLVVYDFHHLDPSQKDFSLGDETSTVKWDKVQTEIDKCILVCINCHKQIHGGDIIIIQEQEDNACE